MELEEKTFKTQYIVLLLSTEEQQAFAICDFKVDSLRDKTPKKFWFSTPGGALSHPEIAPDGGTAELKAATLCLEKSKNHNGLPWKQPN